MFYTVEVRWFYPGEVPEAARAWFFGGGAMVREELARVDHYRRGTGPGVGVKWREGRLEVKTRTAEFGQVQLGAGAVGKLEGYGKEIDWEGRAASRPEEAPEEYLAVHKQRWLRWFAVEGGRARETLEPGEGINCMAELVEVEVGGERWWGAALEAFGGEDTMRLKEALMTAGEVVFGQGDGLDFGEGDSCGYAEFLGRLGDGHSLGV